MRFGEKEENDKSEGEDMRKSREKKEGREEKRRKYNIKHDWKSKRIIDEG